MAGSYFFYDLETSGFDPRGDRIMQFAGQRTNLELEPIGDPVDLLIKLAPDVVPSPDAIMVTGITPQQTLQDGLTEAEFLTEFYDQVVQPDTIYLGFNTVRFDDEFMRFLHWRNFYDPYEWAWKEQCSRWDILDLVRMTRALRPEGIAWPVTEEGKPTNRLELLTKANGLSHEHAHDALSDVTATIAVAKLIQTKQPDLFNYLLGVRDKKSACALVENGQPFVYTSGKYPKETLHTTAAIYLAPHPQSGCGLVYDLRHDPTPFMHMSIEQLADAWRYNVDPNHVRLPVKTIKYNRCPAVAPLGVLMPEAAQRNIGLGLGTVAKHLEILKAGHKDFARNVLAALAQLDAEREQKQQTIVLPVDSRLYESFISDQDKQLMRAVRAAKPSELDVLANDFKDDRLRELLPLYKARNYPKSLTDEQRQQWDQHCRDAVFAGEQQSRLAKFFDRLAELAETKTTPEQQYLLEELQLYGQSIVPSDVAD